MAICVLPAGVGCCEVPDSDRIPLIEEAYMSETFASICRIILMAIFFTVLRSMGYSWDSGHWEWWILTALLVATNVVTLVEKNDSLSERFSKNQNF